MKLGTAETFPAKKTKLGIPWSDVYALIRTGAVQTITCDTHEQACAIRDNARTDMRHYLAKGEKIMTRVLDEVVFLKLTCDSPPRKTAREK